MNLTPLELEIVKHRLEVSDAVAECLEADGFNPEEVEERCGALASDFSLYDDSPLDRAILADCCDGSTFFGTMEYWSPAYRRRRLMAAKTLGEKTGTRVATW